MKLRTKFHLALYLIPLFIFALSIVFYFLNIFGIVILLMDLLLFIGYVLIVGCFRCPKCNVKLIDFYRPLSRYYNGFHYFLSENCNNCGAKLGSMDDANVGKEIRSYDKNNSSGEV